MANNDSYDNHPNASGEERPFVFSGSRREPPRYEERPQGYAPRAAYPEPSRYSGGQGYDDPYAPARGQGYGDRYGSYAGQAGYGRYGEQGGRAYDPYGVRAPQDPYGREQRPVYGDRYADSYADPYADPYAEPYADYDRDGYGQGYEEPEPQPAYEPEQPRGYAFKVRNLTKDYDGNVVLNNISFDIPAGKIVGLLGPNGCGKTTLIKILSGLIHDYTGMIKIGGKPVGIASKASVAYLPDRTYFPERFRTIDCIDYFADFFKDFDKIKAIEFASRFGLDLHQRVRTMSKGMQEKLQLLVVMSRAADIYLLDEPLGGVDPAARGVILDIIMSNYKENATVVLSTHQVNDLEHSFDHVLMLGHGQVLVNTGIQTLRSTGKSVEDIFKEVIGDAWEVE